MANLTISVPDELKSEMDSMTEVNWSDVGRKAIIGYIQSRRSPTPLVDLQIEDATWIYADWQPALQLSLRMRNLMESEIKVNQTVFHLQIQVPGRIFNIAPITHSQSAVLQPGAPWPFQVLLRAQPEAILEMNQQIKSTFFCNIVAMVHGEGFQRPASIRLLTKTGKDEWETFVTQVIYALKTQWTLFSQAVGLMQPGKLA